RETSAWRRDFTGEALLCNSCGIIKSYQRAIESGPDDEIKFIKIENEENGEYKSRRNGFKK
ncbi:4025_t:CDS:2, partial [Diversispora eburnea]